MNIILDFLTTLINVIGIVLFKFWGWVIIAGFLAYKIWQNNKRTEKIVSREPTEHTLLHIIVPKDNDKKELSAEQMFASLHGILRPSGELISEGAFQDHISFEIVSDSQVINFYVWAPTHLKDYVASQVYAQYPAVQITEMEHDYANRDLGGRSAYTTEIVLSKDEIFPIRTFQTFEVDPLAGLTTVLASLSQGEEMWIQFLMEPIDDSWHSKSLKYIDEVINGAKSKVNIELRILAAPFRFLQLLGTPPGSVEKEKQAKKELTPGQTTVNAAVEAKAQKLGYAVKIRAVYIGDNDAAAKQRVQALVGGFKQFNTINLNGFTNTGLVGGAEGVKEYRDRRFDDPGYVLNIEEIASLYHLPHTSVETPGVAYTNTKLGEPPTNLPTLVNTSQEDISLFGTTTFRQAHTKFGIKREDRKRHLYIIGKSGSGKSFLLNLLTLSDVFHNQGFAVVDPHGDYAQDILKFIPESRMKDVVYFNPADKDFPIAFNPMEVHDENRRNNVASEIVGVLKKMFADSWGPRLEHILRFTLLALLETPDTTLLGITRMLSDKKYRNEIIQNITDPVVKAFWVNEFASWNDKFASEAVAPVLNKVGAFTANPLVRNLIGQPRSSFNIRKIMDEGKILIVNLSLGKINEDNAGILGALMITKIQLEAMTRADITDIGERKPFYLYVDEFQNFATESFATILSEARKYGLYLTMANQYVAQMPEEVSDAVFGNVGSMVTFRVGADDASRLSKYFEPVFEPLDLVNLDKQNVYVSMSIDGETSMPFSAKTLYMPTPSENHTEQIVDNSRQMYATPRSEVEKMISIWTGTDEAENKDADKQPQNYSSKHTQYAQQKPHTPSVSGVEPKKYSELVNKNKNHHSGPKQHNNNGGNNSSSNRNRHQNKPFYPAKNKSE
ncbi:MAG: type IV secretion system DNA-binding domain-containing protein [Candidatus Saccharibacteria bacterium]